MQPQISVILPVYNAEIFLAEAINSILQQTFRNFELIIINDGSTDNSKSIIDSYDDDRIRVYHKSNTGLIETLNLGVSYSRANWVARMDADDISNICRFAEQMKFINDDVAVIGSQASLIDENGKVNGLTRFPTQHDEIVSNLLNFISSVIHPSVLINKTFLLRVGGYDSKMYISEDYDLWLRISKIGKIVNVNKPLILLRKHTTNISKEKFSTALENAFVSLAYYFYSESEFTMSLKDYNFIKDKVSALIINFKIRSIEIEKQKEIIKLMSSLSQKIYLIRSPKIFFNFLIIKITKKRLLNKIKKISMV